MSSTVLPSTVLPRAVPTFVAAALVLFLGTGQRAIAHEDRDYGFRIDPKDTQLSAATASDIDQHGIVLTHPTGWQIRVRIAPVDPTASAESLLAKALERIQSDPIYSDANDRESTLAGRPARTVSVTYDYRGTPYRIVARFLVANDLRYIVQSSSTLSDYAKHEKALNEIVNTFEILDVDAAKRAEYRLDGLTRRCGSELRWASRWETAARRAQEEQKLVFVVARYYPGFAISDSLAAGALFDEDVVALINERFVPLRLEKDDPVPFRSYEKYGLGPSTFGRAILLVDAEGEVVTETFTADPWTIDEFLRNALRPAKRSKPSLNKIDSAQSLYAQGHLFEALQQIRETDTLDGLRLRAAIHRRLRNGRQALQDIAAASQLTDQESVAGELMIDEAVLRMRIGERERAQLLLERFLREHTDHSQLPEALYHLASVNFADGATDSGNQLLRTIVDQHAKSRWAWKAAAVLTSSAKDFGIKPRLAWPEATLLEELQPFVREGDAKRAFNNRRARRNARQFLVEQQRPDGTWIYPPDIFRAPDSTQSAIGAAVTALAGYSLLPQRSLPDVRNAIERTLASIEATRKAVAASGELLHYMDYWVWAKTYQLFFVAGSLEARVGDRETLERLGNELVSEIAARQRRSGGWSYYLKHDLTAGDDQKSISFVTAPVVLALLNARKSGLNVDSKVLDRALDCLTAMRNENGTFDYMGGIGIENGSTGLGGAAGRGPLCELALYRGGRGTLEQLRGSLDIFNAHWKGLAREQGKNLMHAGPDSQGSHYILFDCAYTALALGELPKAERPGYSGAIVELLEGAHYGDSFIDNPEMGRASCTALALVTIDALQRRGNDRSRL